MTLQDRDKRAIRMLGIAAAVAIPLYFLTRTPDTAVGPAAAATIAESPEIAEKRLYRTRERAGLLPSRDAIFKKAAAELAVRESGMIQADTAPQAQAQLFQIMRRVGRSQRPPVEVRSTEIGQAKNFAEDYGEVIVSVSFECMVEQYSWSATSCRSPGISCAIASASCTAFSRTPISSADLPQPWHPDAVSS